MTRLFPFVTVLLSTLAASAVTNVTIAANGDGIPYPTATNSYVVFSGTHRYRVPLSMVYVPAGSFIYGTGTNAVTNNLEGYCIGKYPVTEAEYKAFADATHLTSYPSHWKNGTYPAGRDNHPIPYVSLTNALKYCAWVSTNTGWAVTIPTAQQWEKAARGTNDWLYPWGNTHGATYGSKSGVSSRFNFNAVCAAYYLNTLSNTPAVYNNANSPYYNVTTTVGRIAAYATNGTPTYLSVSASCAVSGWVNHDTWSGFIYTDVFDALNGFGGYTTPVGTYTNGVSPYGCHDMAGNLWSWTATLFIAKNGVEAGKLVNQVRGGSWYANATSCQSVDIGEGRSASGMYNTVGFRIAMIPIPEADSVGDGIPDSWRSQYFGGDGSATNAQSCAAADPDNDGMDNRNEFVADTNPTNDLSRFEIQDITRQVSRAIVSFPSSARRTYTLLSHTNLTSGAWGSVIGQADIRGKDGTLSLTNTAPDAPACFFRISVQVP